MNGKEFLESLGISTTDVWIVKDNNVEQINIPYLLDTFCRLKINTLVDDIDLNKLEIDEK